MMDLSPATFKHVARRKPLRDSGDDSDEVSTQRADRSCQRLLNPGTSRVHETPERVWGGCPASC